jgi:hypothetical protein
LQAQSHEESASRTIAGNEFPAINLIRAERAEKSIILRGDSPNFMVYFGVFELPSKELDMVVYAL